MTQNCHAMEKQIQLMFELIENNQRSALRRTKMLLDCVNLSGYTERQASVSNLEVFSVCYVTNRNQKLCLNTDLNIFLLWIWVGFNGKQR